MGILRLNKRRLFRCLVFVLFLFLSGIGNAATINTASCSLADVQSAVNSANTGDTVMVPPGSSTWTTYVTIPNDKKITLMGAGKDLTVITKSPALSSVVSLGTSGSRLTGFGFIDGKIYTKGFDFRIDHCRIFLTEYDVGIDTTPINLGYPMTSIVQKGLIDNNELINARILAISGPFVEYNDNQHFLWSLPLNLGSDEAIYVEDNTFVRDYGNVIDSNYGGGFVFRYNATNGKANIMVHSLQQSQRGTRKWEVYGNIINNPNASTFVPVFFRGGTGTFFFNQIIGNWTYHNIFFDNVRDEDTYSPDDNLTGIGRCDGDNVWDGNLDATGWPCRDQIGTSFDAVQWENDPVGAYTQTRSPAYLWNNYKESNQNVPVLVAAMSSGHIVADRDYYEYNPSSCVSGGSCTSGVGCGAELPVNCTSGVGFWLTNQSCSDLTGMVGPNPATPISGTLYKCNNNGSWVPYYTPYQYPHPLRGGISIKGNATVINMIGGLNIVNMVGGLNVINQ